MEGREEGHRAPRDSGRERPVFITQGMKIAVTHQAMNTSAFSPTRHCKGLIETWQHDDTSGCSLRVGFELSTEEL